MGHSNHDNSNLRFASPTAVAAEATTTSAAAVSRNESNELPWQPTIRHRNDKHPHQGKDHDDNNNNKVAAEAATSAAVSRKESNEFPLQPTIQQNDQHHRQGKDHDDDNNNNSKGAAEATSAAVFRKESNEFPLHPTIQQNDNHYRQGSDHDDNKEEEEEEDDDDDDENYPIAIVPKLLDPSMMTTRPIILEEAVPTPSFFPGGATQQPQVPTHFLDYGDTTTPEDTAVYLMEFLEQQQPHLERWDEDDDDEEEEECVEFLEDTSSSEEDNDKDDDDDDDEGEEEFVIFDTNNFETRLKPNPKGEDGRSENNWTQQVEQGLDRQPSTASLGIAFPLPDVMSNVQYTPQAQASCIQHQHPPQEEQSTPLPTSDLFLASWLAAHHDDDPERPSKSSKSHARKQPPSTGTTRTSQEQPDLFQSSWWMPPLQDEADDDNNDDQIMEAIDNDGFAHLRGTVKNTNNHQDDDKDDKDHADDDNGCLLDGTGSTCDISLSSLSSSSSAGSGRRRRRNKCGVDDHDGGHHDDSRPLLLGATKRRTKKMDWKASATLQHLSLTSSQQRTERGRQRQRSTFAAAATGPPPASSRRITKQATADPTPAQPQRRGRQLWRRNEKSAVSSSSTQQPPQDQGRSRDMRPKNTDQKESPPATPITKPKRGLRMTPEEGRLRARARVMIRQRLQEQTDRFLLLKSVSNSLKKGMPQRTNNSNTNNNTNHKGDNVDDRCDPSETSTILNRTPRKTLRRTDHNSLATTTTTTASPHGSRKATMSSSREAPYSPRPTRESVVLSEPPSPGASLPRHDYLRSSSTRGPRKQPTVPQGPTLHTERRLVERTQSLEYTRRSLSPPKPIHKSTKPLTVPHAPHLLLNAKYGDKIGAVRSRSHSRVRENSITRGGGGGGCNSSLAGRSEDGTTQSGHSNYGSRTSYAFGSHVRAYSHSGTIHNISNHSSGPLHYVGGHYGRSEACERQQVQHDQQQQHGHPKQHPNYEITSASGPSRRTEKPSSPLSSHKKMASPKPETVVPEFRKYGDNKKSLPRREARPCPSSPPRQVSLTGARGSSTTAITMMTATTTTTSLDNYHERSTDPVVVDSSNRNSDDSDRFEPTSPQNKGNDDREPDESLLMPNMDDLLLVRRRKVRGFHYDGGGGFDTVQ
ncbi:hypothetical protein ACA910_011836 [Epithemia clementina (nom. ined.)]